MSASWVGNNRTLLFGGALMQVNVDEVGGGDESFVHWFDDPAGDDLSDGELARQGDRLALVRGYGDDARVWIYRVSGAIGGEAPEPVCETAPSRDTADPSWSPDGSALAYTGPGGIVVVPLPHFASATPCADSVDRLVIPGASQPDWGPADVDPEPVPAPTPAPAPAPHPDPAPAPKPSRAPAPARQRPTHPQLAVARCTQTTSARSPRASGCTPADSARAACAGPSAPRASSAAGA